LPETTRHSLAIIGAGPIGLEAAALALELDFDVHVFERGEVGAHALAWGHVRMFTPWRMNIGPASARLLSRHGWDAPDPAAHPAGTELRVRLATGERVGCFESLDDFGRLLLRRADGAVETISAGDVVSVRWPAAGAPAR